MRDADEDAIEYEQVRRLWCTIAAAGIDLRGLWLQCYSIGGNLDGVEIDACLHRILSLPPSQRDLLDHAAHELMAR
jgi:hypothetical protein